MSFDLIPGAFWKFPSLYKKTFLDDDDWGLAKTDAGGLSIYEDEKNVYVEAAVPGVDPKNVEVTFDKGILWIKAETKEEEGGKKKKFYRKSTSSFSYRVAVPGEIDDKKDPEAVCKNGTITISFAKSPKSQPKKIAVKSAK